MNDWNFTYKYQKFLQIYSTYIDVSTIKLIEFKYNDRTITVNFKNRKDKPRTFDIGDKTYMQSIETTFRNL